MHPGRALCHVLPDGVRICHVGLVPHTSRGDAVHAGVRIASAAESNLRLQLVAASGGFGGERFAFEDDDVFTSSSSSVITASAEMEETWLANQAMIVLPDNGGLMLPLTHKNFLVGLLLVERGGERGRL